MSNQIEVIGSLNPDKECQDRVRVLSGGVFAKPSEQQIIRIRLKFWWR